MQARARSVTKTSHQHTIARKHGHGMSVIGKQDAVLLHSCSLLYTHTHQRTPSLKRAWHVDVLHGSKFGVLARIARIARIALRFFLLLNLSLSVLPHPYPTNPSLHHHIPNAQQECAAVSSAFA